MAKGDQHMSVAYRRRAVALVGAVVIGAVLTASCSPSITRAVSTSSTSSEGAEATTEANSAVDLAGAETSINFARDLAGGWNEISLGWVAAYSDDAVGWEEFLTIQQETLTEMSKLIALGRLEAMKLPIDVQGPATGLVAHYVDRFERFKVVASAMVQRDEQGLEQAFSSYSAVSSPAVVEPLVRAMFEAPTVRDVLALEGVTPQDMMDAMVGVLGS